MIDSNGNYHCEICKEEFAPRAEPDKNLLCDYCYEREYEDIRTVSSSWGRKYMSTDLQF